MIGILLEQDITPIPELMGRLKPGDRIRPEHVRPEEVLPYLEQWHADYSSIPGDLIQTFSPALGIPWIEAMVGCPILMEAGSIWPGRCLPTYHDRSPIRFIPDHPWLQKLIEFTEAMVDFSQGRFPIALPQLRGPLDVLSAMRGAEQMCLDLIDAADAAMGVMHEVTALWIKVAQTLLRRIPTFHGGYVSRMKTWFPGPVATPQNDAAAMISPSMYASYVLPLDGRIVQALPFQCYHWHAAAHHVVDSLLTLDDLTAIQLTLEHTVGGPPLELELSVVRRILEVKPLLVVVPDLKSAEICRRELPGRGLCLTIAPPGFPVQPDILQWVRENCREPA